MKLSIIGAALALAIPATGYAAADCCKDMACCKDGADCFKGRQADHSCCDRSQHGGHSTQAAPAK